MVRLLGLVGLEAEEVSGPQAQPHLRWVISGKETFGRDGRGFIVEGVILSKEFIRVNHFGCVTIIRERFGTWSSPAVWDKTAHVERRIDTETKRESQLVGHIIKFSLYTKGALC